MSPCSKSKRSELTRVRRRPAFLGPPRQGHKSGVTSRVNNLISRPPLKFVESTVALNLTCPAITLVSEIAANFLYGISVVINSQLNQFLGLSSLLLGHVHGRLPRSFLTKGWNYLSVRRPCCYLSIWSILGPAFDA